jgi:hypothetical protein
MWLVIFLMVVAASGGVPVTVYLGRNAPSHRKTSHAFTAVTTGPRP